MAALALRTDYDASGLRALAKSSKNGGLTRRLLSLAAIYDGGSRTDAARIGQLSTPVCRCVCQQREIADFAEPRDADLHAQGQGGAAGESLG